MPTLDTFSYTLMDQRGVLSLFIDNSSSAIDSSSSSSTGSSDVGPSSAQQLLSFLYLSFSIFSLLLSLTVIISYLLFASLRHHPNSFVFWRSCFDILYSLQFIIFSTIEPYNSRPNYCQYFTPIFQFSLLGSQSFYFCLSIDLFISLQNPFLSLSSSSLYHIYVWSSSLITALIISVTGQAGFRPGMDICWIKPSTTGNLNSLAWSLFFGPTCLYYVSAIFVTIYATLRLQQGLRQTFNTRLKVLHDSTRYVLSFTIYWTIAGIIYFMIYQAEHESSDPSTLVNDHSALYVAFAVTLVLRATFDEIVWIYNNQVFSLYKRWLIKKRKQQAGGLLDTNDSDHTGDLSPIHTVNTDINQALRREVLIFTTNGIIHSILKHKETHEQRRIERLEEAARTNDQGKLTYYPEPTLEHYPTSVHVKSTTSAARRLILSSHNDDNDNDPASPNMRTKQKNTILGCLPSASAMKVPFIDYAPVPFDYLRHCWHISPDSYVASLKGNTEAMLEKYTEGRSSSFFYYTEDSAYIVKTLSETEALLLLDILPSYCHYMSYHPNTLLCKFTGLHCIQLYRITLYFVVMQSIFLTPILSLTIDERYDLKGSYIDRFTGREYRGVYSNSPYYANSTKKKSKKGTGKTGGKVLKDLDYTGNLIMNAKDKKIFLQQCLEDSAYLCDHGIMDYSLLLGIHYTKHRVGLTTDTESPNTMTPIHHDNHKSNFIGNHNNQPSSNYISRWQRDDGGLRASVIHGPSHYFMGIIDILQAYDKQKECERCTKVFCLCKDGKGISALPPAEYQERFVAAMESIVTVINDTDQINDSSVQYYSNSISLPIQRHQQNTNDTRVRSTMAISADGISRPILQVTPVASSSSSSSLQLSIPPVARENISAEVIDDTEHIEEKKKSTSP